MRMMIEDEAQLMNNRDSQESGSKSILINTGKLFGILVVAVIIAELLRGLYLGNQNMMMIYLLAVFTVSFVTPTYVYGIIAALLGTFAYDFLITPPRFGFSFSTGSPITLVIMIVVTLAASTMTMRIKEKARLAREREYRTKVLYEMNQKLLMVRDLENIRRLTGEYLVIHLRHPAMLYTGDPADACSFFCEGVGDVAEDYRVFYTPEQIKRVHRLFRLGRPETDRPEDNGAYEVFNVPVLSKGKTLGVVAVSCRTERLTRSGEMLVHMLVGQLALALELQHLADERSGIAMEAEKEKTLGTLLRSISHDLRTPLTSILGASTAILEQGDMDAQTREGLVKDIRLDAQWLIRMVENILIITRMSGDNLKVERKPEAAEEVVSGAVDIVRKRFPDYQIHVHAPEELVVVLIDATLISQVLINLLENGIKNSPERSLILVDVKKLDGWVEFDVSDNGSGIPGHLLDSLFEMHPPTKEQAVEASKGMGIGLNICKTIVQAHGGLIEGHNRKGQGARFSFRLPLEERTDD